MTYVTTKIANCSYVKRGLPTGTVTFLFTDIEDSARLWDKDPRAMESALDRHDAILQQVAEAND